MDTRGADAAPKFRIGRVSLTPGALRLPPADIELALTRHRDGDWGDLGPEAREGNESALAEGEDSRPHTTPPTA